MNMPFIDHDFGSELEEELKAGQANIGPWRHIHVLLKKNPGDISYYVTIKFHVTLQIN